MRSVRDGRPATDVEAPLSSSDSLGVRFERGDDTLVIYDLAMAPGVNGGDALALATGPFSGAPVLPTPGLRATAGFVVTEEPGVTALAVVTASTGHIFKLTFTSTCPAATVAPFIVDVAHRQQQRAGGPPAASQGGIDRGRERGARSAVHHLSSRLRHRRRPDRDDPQGVSTTCAGMARSQRVVDLLNGSPLRHRIFGIGAGRFLIVTLGQQPFDEFAATELGGYRNTTQIVDRRLGEKNEGAIGFRFRDGDQYGVAFRRGPYVVNVSVVGPDIQAAAAMRLVDEVARQQAVLLPPGGTAPYLLPLFHPTLGGPRGRVHHGHLPHRLRPGSVCCVVGAGLLHRHHVPRPCRHRRASATSST